MLGLGVWGEFWGLCACVFCDWDFVCGLGVIASGLALHAGLALPGALHCSTQCLTKRLPGWLCDRAKIILCTYARLQCVGH